MWRMDPLRGLEKQYIYYTYISFEIDIDCWARKLNLPQLIIFKWMKIHLNMPCLLSITLFWCRLSGIGPCLEPIASMNARNSEWLKAWTPLTFTEGQNVLGQVAMNENIKVSRAVSLITSPAEYRVVQSMTWMPRRTQRKMININGFVKISIWGG